MALKSVDIWLEEYGESHQNPVNKAIHWICVPLIALSLVGVLWDLPVPRAFADISPVMNWGMLFLMASIVYYFILSPRLALGMVIVIAGYSAWCAACAFRCHGAVLRAYRHELRSRPVP